MRDLLPLLLFTLTTTFTPGPNNIMLMNSGMHFGIKRSLWHFLGICLGFPFLVLAVSVGLSAIFTEYSWIKSILKIVGSLYMLYLAWQILRSHNKGTNHTLRPIGFVQALMFQAINPKAWLIAVSTISIFTVVDNDFYNALIISFTYFLVCIPCTGSWMVFGKFLQQILKKDSHRIWFNIIMAIGLVGSIGLIWID